MGHHASLYFCIPCSDFNSAPPKSHESRIFTASSQMAQGKKKNSPVSSCLGMLKVNRCSKNTDKSNTIVSIVFM